MHIGNIKCIAIYLLISEYQNFSGKLFNNVSLLIIIEKNN